MKNWLIILLALILPGVEDVQAKKAEEMLGQMRPEFQLPDLDGKTRGPDDWRGKVLVVNFWATWCTPCLKEIPMFNRVQKEYGPDGVQFIGIAVDNKDAIEQFMKKVPIDYPVLHGVQAATKITQEYGNRAGVLPFTVFVDKQGRIQRIAPGKISEKYTRESIEALL